MESSPVVTPVSPMVVPKKGLERMWESIVLTVAATAGNNIGKILQKKGTVILPPLSFKFKVIRVYALNKTWLIGFLMDIFGALLMLRALALAPVSIIQHVSGCGLAILSIFSHFYLKEVMNAADWVGITLAGFGTIVFMLIAHIWNGGGCCCCKRVHIDVGGRESRPCDCHRAALESLNASAIGAAPFALPSLVKWVDLYSMANVMCLRVGELNNKNVMADHWFKSFLSPYYAQKRLVSS